MRTRLLLLAVLAATALLAVTAGSASAKSCGTVRIQFRSDQPELPLKVNKSGRKLTCPRARRTAARLAETRGLWLPRKWACSVQTGPTIGRCQRRGVGRFSWALKA